MKWPPGEVASGRRVVAKRTPTRGGPSTIIKSHYFVSRETVLVEKNHTFSIMPNDMYDTFVSK